MKGSATEIIKGTSRGGSERELVCSTTDGKLCLWVRPPGSQEGGYEILVPADELLSVLARRMMGAPVPGEAG